MAENNSEESSPISQEQTDQIARKLNIIFNTATLYGGSHPSTKKSAGEFSQFLDKIFDDIPMITLLRMGDSLYIEKSCVDHRMNPSRIIAYFERIGIESVSFKKGIVEEDIKVFIRVFSDYKSFPTVGKMSEELKKHGVSNILLNFVFLQKVTKDDTVVDKDSLIKEESQDVDEKKVYEQIGRLFSLKDIVDNPGSIAQNILTKSEKSGEGDFSIISQLKDINKQIRDTGSKDASISADDMMESFFQLTSELKNQLSVQKEMGKLDEEQELVIDDIDKMTYETIIQIVRDEYKHGEISVKRLSQIIRRVLPDIKDLKKLLPRLKEALLKDGMPLSDFLQLTKELNKELQSDGLLEKLEEGAEQIGLTVEDIVKAFNANPTEAAKIIVLASEIGQETGEDQSQMSSVLADYIESVSSKMTIDSPATADKSGGKVLGKIIHQIESQLVERLKSQNLSKSIVNEVEKQLAERFPKTLSKLKVDWIVNVISSGEELSNMYLVRLLTTVVNKKADLDIIKDPIEKALLARGLNEEQVQEVFKEIINNLEKKQKSMSLLKIILSNTNTKFFIDRLIKENLRYNNPFTCINVSVSAANIAGKWSAVTPDIVSKVMPDICNIMKKLLRDIDLIGSLGKVDENSIFIILPMTNEYGADVVKGRLAKKFSQTDFELDGQVVKLEVTQSVSPFSSDKTPDYKSYIEFVNKMHKLEESKYKV